MVIMVPIFSNKIKVEKSKLLITRVNHSHNNDHTLMISGEAITVCCVK